MALRPRKTAKNFANASERSFRHFCQSTSIHGVKYIVEDQKHWIERLAWLLVFLAGLSFSSYFCWQMWGKWEESPVITSVDSTRYPLKDAPFPAVTICNVNKVSRRNLEKVLSTDSRFQGKVSYNVMQDTLRYMTKLDRAILNEKPLQKLSDHYKSLGISPNDLFDVLMKTSPSCEQLIMDCAWQGLPDSCLNYFSFLPTDDGICCTFNGGNYSDPDINIVSRNHTLLRINGNGYRMGLALVLNADVKDYSVTNGKFDGFKVLVHSQGEFPDISDRGFVVGPGEETFVAVQETSTFYTKELVKQVQPSKRGCLVDDEVKLKYFTEYSRSACEVECATKIMLDRCQCRPYFFRAEKGASLCGLESYSCVNNVYEEVRLRGDEICNCLPPCADEWYDPEISAAPFPGHGFNLTRTFKRLAENLNLNPKTDTTQYFKSNMAVLHVYFKEKTGMRYKTDVRFGIEDFISAMGGLLGLGMGVSFISIVEIIYFVCVYHCVRPPQEDEEEPRRSQNRNNKTTWPSTATVMTTSAAPSQNNLELDESALRNRTAN